MGKAYFTIPAIDPSPAADVAARAGAARALIIFYVLAFALTWLCWAPLVSARFEGNAGPTWLHLVGSLGPAMAALIAARLVHGRRAAGDLIRALSPARVTGLGWALAIGGPALLFVVGLGVERVQGGSWPEARLALSASEYPWFGPFALVLAQIAFYGIGEEIGWRGFALPLLMERMGPLAASALITVPWALWHLPLFVASDTLGAMGPAGIAGWAISLLTGSFLTTWLFLVTRSSILAVAVFHGLLDIAMANPAVGMLGMNVEGALVTMAGIAAAYRLLLMGRIRVR